jgi:hypothetical protein
MYAHKRTWLWLSVNIMLTGALTLAADLVAERYEKMIGAVVLRTIRRMRTLEGLEGLVR